MSIEALARRAPPFNSETARIAAAKSVASRKAQREAGEGMQPNERNPVSAQSKPCPGSIALIRRAWRRFWQLAIATDDPDIAGKWVAHASEAFEQDQRLCGRDARKSKPKTELANPAPKPIAPISRAPSEPVDFPPLAIPEG